MKKVLVSLLLFGFLLLILTVSCTTKYLTKDQLPQDKIIIQEFSLVSR